MPSHWQRRLPEDNLLAGLGIDGIDLDALVDAGDLSQHLQRATGLRGQSHDGQAPRGAGLIGGVRGRPPRAACRVRRDAASGWALPAHRLQLSAARRALPPIR